MKVHGHSYRTIWPTDDGRAVEIIDQTRLPHTFEIIKLQSAEAIAEAIRSMKVRGAPLIGAAAAYGVALALIHDPSDGGLDRAIGMLGATRPTAINLRWALGRMASAVKPVKQRARAEVAFAEANATAEEDVAINAAIGGHGSVLLRAAYEKKRRDGCLNILTHCMQAGWPLSIGAPPWPPSTVPTRMGYPCMYGSMKRARACRER